MANFLSRPGRKAVLFFLTACIIACGVEILSLNPVQIILEAQSKAKSSERAAVLNDSTRVLEQLSRSSGNTIPDAVLNRTKCLLLLPASTAATDQRTVRGVATCRETSEQWKNPAFITFTEQGRRTQGADRLIFILQDAAVRALESGRLQIRARNHIAEPLVSTDPVPSQVELTADLLVYNHAADQLSGSAATGVVALDDDRSPPISGRASSKVPEKISRQYLSSVVSFFNSIIPTGIVIHHTAIIPSENALPGSEREVDRYHQARGFEITCFG
jgi:lipid-binding SYLF domain-containing protein